MPQLDTRDESSAPGRLQILCGIEATTNERVSFTVIPGSQGVFSGATRQLIGGHGNFFGMNKSLGYTGCRILGTGVPSRLWM